MSEQPSIERLRKLCLRLPESSETNSWNHPNFRAGKRTFVTFERFANENSIAFRLPEDDVQALLEEDQFFLTPYGRGQWVSIRARPDLDWQLVETLVMRAYRTVAIKRMLLELDRTDSQP